MRFSSHCWTLIFHRWTRFCVSLESHPSKAFRVSMLFAIFSTSVSSSTLSFYDPRCLMVSWYSLFACFSSVRSRTSFCGKHGLLSGKSETSWFWYSNVVHSRGFAIPRDNEFWRHFNEGNCAALVLFCWMWVGCWWKFWWWLWWLMGIDDDKHFLVRSSTKHVKFSWQIFRWLNPNGQHLPKR